MVDVGKLLAHDLGRAALVFRVDEAEQEHDCDRSHTELAEPLHTPAHRVLVERQEHLAVEVDALGDRDARPAARDGRRRGVARIPDLFLVHPTHLDLVAVPFGDQQARLGAVHLDHRVVGGRGAVHEDVDVAAQLRDGDPEPGGELLEPLHHAGRLVVERRVGLVERDVTCRGHADDVGERAADVHTDPVAH